MNIFIGGNPLTKNDDDKTIYTQHRFMPPLSPLESFPKVRKSDVNSFIEHLYFLTMEENGFSYFYPNMDNGVNLCRFEWHFEYKENPYEIRVGLSFKVINGSIDDVGFYIVPHEYYENLGQNQDGYEIEEDAYNTMVDSINHKVQKALKLAKTQPETVFNVLYYIQLSDPIAEVVELSRSITLLPSRLVDGNVVSAVLIKEVGHSYLSAKRFSDEKVNLICAIASLVTGKAKVINLESLPSYIKPIDREFELSDQIIDKFYPNSISRNIAKNSVSNDNIQFIAHMLEVFETQTEKKPRRKLLNILFSYYSALETEAINQTVGLVGYVACLDAIAKECFSTYRDKHGSRKALVHGVVQLLSKSDESDEIDTWSKRIYNDHRSSYVHGANIRFEAFSQNMDGKNFAGLPKALPSQNKPVSKQYEYNSDFTILKQATLEMLIKFIEVSVDSKLPNVISQGELSFKRKSIPEAYLSMPNKGWVRLTGNQA